MTALVRPNINILPALPVMFSPAVPATGNICAAMQPLVRADIRQAKPAVPDMTAK